MPSQVINIQGKISGEYTPPGDKSISHRVVMFGALAEGESSARGFLLAEDCLHTLSAFKAMGVEAELNEADASIKIKGLGLRGLQAPTEELYVGNSGTSMRLLMGILGGQRFEAVLSGDPSLSKRPMKRVSDPLKKMGVQIKGAENGNFAPLRVRGGRLKGIDYDNVLASAQVKSAILLAGLYGEGETIVSEPRTSRDHTERFLEFCGANFKRGENQELIVQSTDSLKPFDVQVPGDISSAAFFIVAAAIQSGARIKILNVGLNPLRTGLLTVLERMGAKIQVEQTVDVPEPLGSITVEGGRLKGTRITRDEIPGLIDELPILLVAMALAEGESLLSGAEELRVKETDRIHSMVTNLEKIGADIEELPDGCLLKGVEQFQSATVDSFGDHRTAMSMAVANLCMEGDVTIENTQCVSTSFPSFFDDLARLTQG